MTEQTTTMTTREALIMAAVVLPLSLAVTFFVVVPIIESFDRPRVYSAPKPTIADVLDRLDRLEAAIENNR